MEAAAKQMGMGGAKLPGLGGGMDCPLACLVSGKRNRSSIMYTNAPTLLSENIILRGPEARDQEPVIAFLQDEDRAAGFGPAQSFGSR